MIKILISLLLLAAPAAAGSFLLNPPIDCTLGETCYIQQYVDRDPGPGAADYSCGTLSYDGHDGTDFALPSKAAMQAGVDVLAAAPGTVVALRDGMPDLGLATPGLEGRECGNGVVLRHGGGWVTQYCHLKEGSVIVQNGQRVAKGAVLGEVGFSGMTEFPHVELTLRHNGEPVDPFAPDSSPPSCAAPLPEGLWQTPIPYAPGGVISAGFTGTVPSYAAVKEGMETPSTLPGTTPALILWAYAYGGQTDDVLRLEITGPNGAKLVSGGEPLASNKAQFYRYIGKRTPDGGWPAGTYRGVVSLTRDGVEIGRHDIDIALSDN